MVAFLLFTIQGFLEPQFRPTFVLVQNNNLKREMEQFIIILCYTTYKIMRSHFKVISVLCYFPSDRYFMYFLMKFFFRSFLPFVLLRIQHQLFEYVLSKKTGLLHFPRKKSFLVTIVLKGFPAFGTSISFATKIQRYFWAPFHYQNGMQYVTCIVTTLRTVILVMYYKITRSLGSYTFYVFLFLFPMGLEKWSNRPASEKKESLFFGSWRKR